MMTVTSSTLCSNLRSGPVAIAARLAYNDITSE
jgi:hypothetical protein